MKQIFRLYIISLILSSCFGSNDESKSNTRVNGQDSGSTDSTRGQKYPKSQEINPNNNLPVERAKIKIKSGNIIYVDQLSVETISDLSIQEQRELKEMYNNNLIDLSQRKTGVEDLKRALSNPEYTVGLPGIPFVEDLTLKNIQNLNYPNRNKLKAKYNNGKLDLNKLNDGWGNNHIKRAILNPDKIVAVGKIYFISDLTESNLLNLREGEAQQIQKLIRERKLNEKYLNNDQLNYIDNTANPVPLKIKGESKNKDNINRQSSRPSSNKPRVPGSKDKPNQGPNTIEPKLIVISPESSIVKSGKVFRTYIALPKGKDLSRDQRLQWLSLHGVDPNNNLKDTILVNASRSTISFDGGGIHGVIAEYLREVEGQSGLVNLTLANGTIITDNNGNLINSKDRSLDPGKFAISDAPTFGNIYHINGPSNGMDRSSLRSGIKEMLIHADMKGDRLMILCAISTAIFSSTRNEAVEAYNAIMLGIQDFYDTEIGKNSDLKIHLNMFEKNYKHGDKLNRNNVSLNLELENAFKAIPMFILKQ